LLIAGLTNFMHLFNAQLKKFKYKNCVCSSLYNPLGFSVSQEKKFFHYISVFHCSTTTITVQEHNKLAAQGWLDEHYVMGTFSFFHLNILSHILSGSSTKYVPPEGAILPESWKTVEVPIFETNKLKGTYTILHANVHGMGWTMGALVSCSYDQS
jgi:hypothetical protein